MVEIEQNKPKRVVVIDPVTGLPVVIGGGGSTTFIGLTDTPANYTGQAGNFVRVNVGETGLEFAAGGGTVNNLQDAWQGGPDIDVSTGNAFQVRDNGIALGENSSDVFPGIYADIADPGLAFGMINDGSSGIPGVAGGQQVILDTAVTFPAAGQIEFGVDLRVQGGAVISEATAAGAGALFLNTNLVVLKDADVSAEEGTYTIIGFANGITTNSIALVVNTVTQATPAWTATSGTAKIFKQSFGFNGGADDQGVQNSFIASGQGDGLGTFSALVADGCNYKNIHATFSTGGLQAPMYQFLNFGVALGEAAHQPFMDFNTAGNVNAGDIRFAPKTTDPTITNTLGPATTISFQDNGVGNRPYILDSGNGLITAMFKGELVVQVTGSASNDGFYSLDAVEAGRLILSDSSVIVNEAAGASVTLTQTNLVSGELWYSVDAANPSGVWKYFDATGAIVTVGAGAGGGTLNDSYNFGGPGAGRNIVADSGAVAIQQGDVAPTSAINLFADSVGLSVDNRRTAPASFIGGGISYLFNDNTQMAGYAATLEQVAEQAVTMTAATDDMDFGIDLLAAGVILGASQVILESSANNDDGVYVITAVSGGSNNIASLFNLQTSLPASFTDTSGNALVTFPTAITAIPVASLAGLYRADGISLDTALELEAYGAGSSHALRTNLEAGTLSTAKHIESFSEGSSVFSVDKDGTVNFGNTTNGNLIGISAGTPTASYDITLPPQQATGAGQAMINNGSGVLSWGTPGEVTIGPTTGDFVDIRSAIAGTTGGDRIFRIVESGSDSGAPSAIPWPNGKITIIFDAPFIIWTLDDVQFTGASSNHVEVIGISPTYSFGSSVDSTFRIDHDTIGQEVFDFIGSDGSVVMRNMRVEYTLSTTFGGNFSNAANQIYENHHHVMGNTAGGGGIGSANEQLTLKNVTFEGGGASCENALTTFGNPADIRDITFIGTYANGGTIANFGTNTFAENINVSLTNPGIIDLGDKAVHVLENSGSTLTLQGGSGSYDKIQGSSITLITDLQGGRYSNFSITDLTHTAGVDNQFVNGEVFNAVTHGASINHAFFDNVIFHSGSDISGDNIKFANCRAGGTGVPGTETFTVNASANNTQFSLCSTDDPGGIVDNGTGTVNIGPSTY